MLDEIRLYSAQLGLGFELRLVKHCDTLLASSFFRSECGIAQFSLPLFVSVSCCSRYAGFVDLIHVNNLLNDVKIQGDYTDRQKDTDLDMLIMQSW